MRRRTIPSSRATVTTRLFAISHQELRGRRAIRVEAEPLLERAGELAAIAAALQAVKGGDGRVLVIEAPAGIGKTALLQAAEAAARDAGIAALSGTGGALERDLGFGVVEQLLAGAVRAAGADALTGHARLAAPILGLGSESGDGGRAGEAMFSTLQALYWLTVSLAEREPIALLVDDAHLADSASLRFLAYLANRLDGVPALLVAATRSGAEGEAVLQALASAPRLQPGPLSAQATATLVRSIVPSADDASCGACFEATGGNAFFVRELAHELGGETATRSGGLLDRSPERVASHVRARLLALSAQARELARAVAVLGKEAALRHAAALARLDPDTALEASDELRAYGILVRERALEFVHPIIRAAVYEQLAPGARTARHGEAATLLAAEHAPAERIAAHLLHSEALGGRETCEQLRDAARAAMTRGAPEAAVAYLRRALAEPPPPASRAAVMLELALAEGSMFDIVSAAERLREAFEVAPDASTRLLVARTAASVGASGEQAEWAIAMLERAREDPEHDEAVRIAIDADIANVARFELEPRRSCLPVSRRLRTFADSGLALDAATLAASSAELVMAGGPVQRVAEVARAGVAALRGDRPMPAMVVPLVLVRVLMVCDEFDLAGELLDSLLADSRRRGSVLDFAFASTFRGELMYRLGWVLEAEEEATTVHALSTEHGWPMGGPAVGSDLIHALIERGELERATTVLEQTERVASKGELRAQYTFSLLLHARGRLRIVTGDPGSALADLLECGRRQELWEEHNPSLIPWRSEAALALSALERADEARELAADEVQLARQFGARRALGIALCVAGSVGEGDEALLLAREAVAVLADSPARLEHGRALLELGRRLRVDGERTESRERLRQALELSHVCGAAALEQSALAALRADGARPRRARLSGPDALTPSERRVARMAAHGASNREIAEALFVTVRTVEFHLAGAYRKLRIDGRQRLAAALGDAGRLASSDGLSAGHAAAGDIARET